MICSMEPKRRLRSPPLTLTTMPGHKAKSDGKCSLRTINRRLHLLLSNQTGCVEHLKTLNPHNSSSYFHTYTISYEIAINWQVNPESCRQPLLETQQAYLLCC